MSKISKRFGLLLTKKFYFFLLGIKPKINNLKLIKKHPNHTHDYTN